MNNANYQSERSRLPVSPYTGYVDIMVNPDGTVLPRRFIPLGVVRYVGGLLPLLASRARRHRRTRRLERCPDAADQRPTIPPTHHTPERIGCLAYSVTALKGENRLMTLFTRTGQITTDESLFFDDPFNPRNSTIGYNISLPFLDAAGTCRRAMNMIARIHVRCRPGITLTEILIAIMIMGVGLITLATLFPIRSPGSRCDAVQPLRDPAANRRLGRLGGIIQQPILYIPGQRESSVQHSILADITILVRHANVPNSQRLQSSHRGYAILRR